jgi:Domain of unknown function (DUF5615)
VVTETLRALGHDVLTAQDDGRANQRIADTDVLARATALGRAVLTNNRKHFHRLHRIAPNHAGVVTYTDDHKQRSAIAARIDAALAATPSAAGHLIRVIRPNPPQVP